MNSFDGPRSPLNNIAVRISAGNLPRWLPSSNYPENPDKCRDNILKHVTDSSKFPYVRITLTYTIPAT
jgi:hypothetical protein